MHAILIILQGLDSGAQYSVPTLPPAPLLRRVWVLLLDDLRKRHPDLRVGLQAPYQPHLETLVGNYCLPTLDFSCIRVSITALWGTIIAMSFQRVWACEEVPAEHAKVDFKRVRLHLVAVPLERLPVAETRTGAEPALENADDTTYPVVWCSIEEREVPILDSFRDVEETAPRRI